MVFALIGLPVVLVLISRRIALLAKSLAEKQCDGSPAYPTAEMLDATFTPESEGVWPPPPTVGQEFP